MPEDLGSLSNRQKVALAAAVGAGVLVGAGGLIIYQRLNQNVSLSVAGRDFSQELTTLSQSIERLRKDIENLRGIVSPQEEVSRVPLKSALKRSTSFNPAPDLLDNGDGDVILSSRHVRSLSTCSSFTNGSSSGTEYFSALSDDEELTTHTFRCHEESVEVVGKVQILSAVDELMDGRDEQQQEALDVLLQHENELGESPAYLWRLCKARYLLAVIAGQAGDSDKKKELILSALESGESALRLDERNAEAHKWYAIVLGSRGEFGGVREKILDGFEFKKHIDRAAELNPSDYIIHHLLGRFCYEVSQLSWLERKMAATLFAEPPSASLDEALKHFLEAEKMKPDGWKENRLYIAKCHIGKKDFVPAMTWLDRADSIPLAGEDVRDGIKDRLSQQEIDKLMITYEKYRV